MTSHYWGPQFKLVGAVTSHASVTSTFCPAGISHTHSIIPSLAPSNPKLLLALLESSPVSSWFSSSSPTFHRALIPFATWTSFGMLNPFSFTTVRLLEPAFADDAMV
ncbi:hypothetical protein FRC18_007525 [Serendipita sp. 400]|nr:hypothetical protein FRC18_007525 [Serendipita sp. 400]